MIQDDRSIILLSGNRMLNTPLENHDPRLNMCDHNIHGRWIIEKTYDYMSVYVRTHHIYYFIILLPFLLSWVLGSSLFDKGVAG